MKELSVKGAQGYVTECKGSAVLAQSLEVLKLVTIYVSIC